MITQGYKDFLETYEVPMFQDGQGWIDTSVTFADMSKNKLPQPLKSLAIAQYCLAMRVAELIDLDNEDDGNRLELETSKRHSPYGAYQKRVYDIYEKLSEADKEIAQYIVNF